MTVRRLAAILFIFVSTAIAWFVLGATVTSRTDRSKSEGGQSVAALWGGRHNQEAPQVFSRRTREVFEEVTEEDDEGNETTRRIKKLEEYSVSLPLDSSTIDVRLGVEHRKKGLLWHDTYRVDFRGVFSVTVPEVEAKSTCFFFRFPSASAIYDGFSVTVDGEELAPRVKTSQEGASVKLAHRGEAVHEIEVRYASRGLDAWRYFFADRITAGVGQVRDFQLDLTTDFGDVDFPAGGLSPTEKSPTDRGWRLSWRFDNLVTGQHIALDVPNRLNPGPLVSRITFFAPVSLLFFITVLVLLGALGHLELHPMHYFFLSAAFFSFHLLLAYLADQTDIHRAFSVAAGVSLILVLSYLRLICGLRKALLYAGSAQVVYLVLFSYAFFFEGLTGLTVTLGAIMTLFVMMQTTAGVDWNRVLGPASGPIAESEEGA